MVTPVRDEGRVVLERASLIAMIMEETTDDIVSDGWDHLGKPNVLVQGCRYIRRNAAPSPEGYVNPEASANQFAGFIADRILKALATREEAPAPNCQKCGGEIAGWCCQQCHAEFRENDRGALIFEGDVTPAAPEAEKLREAMPDLSSVIAWLNNGCAPEHAVTELTIYKARIDQVLSAPARVETVE